jgi:hypothetical protein
VKISSERFEVNLRIPRDEVPRLRLVTSADWNKRESIRLGQVGDAAAFWCSGEDGTVSILVGHDDETWDVAVTLEGDSIAPRSRSRSRLATERRTVGSL